MPWSFDPSVAALWLDLFWVVSENRQQGSSRGADFGRDGGKKSNSLHPAIARHFCPTLPSPFYRTGSRCSGRINECLLQGHHLVSACLGLSPSVTGLCPAPVRPLSQKGEPSAQRRAKQHADRSTHPWSRKIPHATEQLSQCITTTEAHTLRACALQKEKPQSATGSPRTTT